MAYLNKDQYDRRRENAAQRNIVNSEIAVANGMTEEQAELITRLCALRHELHTNIDSLVTGEDNNRIEERLIKLNSDIREAGLAPMSHIPAYTDDYIDIDSMACITEDPEAYGEDMPERGTDEWQQWHNRVSGRIYEQWSELHGKIEDYLRSIDNKYNTSFCPTGAQRLY